MSTPEGTFSDRVQQEATAARDSAKSYIDATAEEVETAANSAEATVRDGVSRMIEQSRDVAASATQYVRDNPLRSVGIAVAVGVVAGLLTRRWH